MLTGTRRHVLLLFHKKTHFCSRSSSEDGVQEDRRIIPADDWRLAAIHGVASFPGLSWQVCGRSTLLYWASLARVEQGRKQTGALTRSAAGGHLWGCADVALFLLDRHTDGHDVIKSGPDKQEHQNFLSQVLQLL